jgi:hypothetical protein
MESTWHPSRSAMADLERVPSSRISRGESPERRGWVAVLEPKLMPLSRNQTASSQFRTGIDSVEPKPLKDRPGVHQEIAVSVFKSQ